MNTATDLPILAFPSQQAWETWLAEQHATSSGVWLQIAKSDTGIDTVSYAQAVDVALCYGWIDSQMGRLDDQYYVQRFTPRRAKSKWSKINRRKAEELIAAGSMRPAGLREVQRAKADGRWEAAYDSPRTAEVPADFQRALDADPVAAGFFATLDRANRYAILYRIQDAKRPQTRERRIEQFVAMLREHRKIHS